MKTIVKTVKRNPVIIVAVVVILVQAWQKAYTSGDFTWNTYINYVFQLVMAFVAREFTVPASEHLEVVKHRDALGRDVNKLLKQSYDSSEISKENGSSS